MSDHFSGPRALADPAADITDVFAFPAPGSPQRLVVAMDVFSKAGASAVFSDAVIYRFRIRPVTMSSTGPAAAFAVGDPEVTFDCSFDLPDPVAGGPPPVQRGRCVMPDGRSVAIQTNQESGTFEGGIRVFAGQRSDPFFLDVRMVEKTALTGKLAFKQVGSDTLFGTNVLSIVLEIEWPQWLTGGPLFAVVAETLAAGRKPVRIERVGRPEIKNVTLSWKMFDEVNRDLEIRDLYNSEDAFKLSQEYVGAYRARMNANLAFYDGLDGKTDWPFDQHGNHPLTEILLADFLVVDVSKPFSETGYFDIETSMRGGRSHTTPGGRWLNEDMMGFIFTLYVNAGNGPRIEDGVAGPIAWSTKSFPYLAPPNRPKGSTS